MERKLKKLLDYQRFERSPRLEKLIREAEGRGMRELTDEEAGSVSAAGLFGWNKFDEKPGGGQP